MNVEGLLLPLDRFRTGVIRRVPKPLLDREARLALIAIVASTIAFAFAALLPVWQIGIGTIVLGVPHVAADLRYLVVRPRIHRRRGVAIALGLGLLSSFVLGLPGVLFGASIAVLFARARLSKRIAISIACMVLGVLAMRITISTYVFVHLHNFIALAFYLAWRKRRGASHWIVAGLFLAGQIALWFTTPLALGVPTGMERIASELLPKGCSIPATYAVGSFAFAQSLHFLVWLKLIPSESSRSSSLSLRQSFRSATRDLGMPVIVVCALAMLAFACAAFVDVGAARTTYLRVAFWHAYLELGIGALWLCEGRRPA